MIEKRRAGFERMRHAHAIALIQDVVGEVADLIEPKELIEGAGLGRLFGKEVFERLVAVESRQSPLSTVIEGAIPEEMRLHRIEHGAGKKPFRFVLEAD